jgi:two-component system, LytTR family, sensor kinase
MREMDNAQNPRSMNWSWSALLWGSVALFDATQTVVVMHSEDMHHNWISLFLTTFLSFLPWFVATPYVLKLGRRFPPTRLMPLSTWLIHIAACLIVGTVYSAWTAAFQHAFNPYAYADPKTFLQLWSSLFYNGLLSHVILYGLILMVGQMLESRERLARQQTEAARLNEELSRAQLEALRRQIEPHFLFNTLNSIVGLVREQRNEDAVRMIAGLSDCLRRVLDSSQNQEATLGEEIEFLEKYLEIQKARFAERLDVRVDVDKELYKAQVPSLILQPMVENAIQHGISRRSRGGSVRVGASQSDGVLVLRVYNDGPKLPPDWETSRSGIGIPNVRNRLQSLYGDASGVQIRNQDQGVEVCLTVPFRETEIK